MKTLVFVLVGCMTCFDTGQSFAGARSQTHYEALASMQTFRTECAQFNFRHPECQSHLYPTVEEERARVAAGGLGEPLLTSVAQRAARRVDGCEGADAQQHAIPEIKWPFVFR